MNAAIAESQSRTDAQLARLENALRQAWSDFIEESGPREGLEAIGREMFARATEGRSWNGQEQFAAVEVVERASEQLEGL